ncbi:MAG: hypothetical protein P8P56_08385 [Yoonia sp.]|nr:hypothetical protein [Yoonia sp.]MDG1862730.1 hypothetical protein [Yoonia sp.]
MRSIILLVIGLFFGTGIGFLLGMPATEHDHASHADASHDHSALTLWNGPTPDIALQLFHDSGDAQNLLIDITGFTFTPEAVNTAAVDGTGHAHVYVDGVKVGRAYGPWMLLDDAPSGSIVRVTLNANDHTVWGLGDTPIVAEITVP